MRPASPYGAAKLGGETYVEAFGRSRGIAGTSLRLGNVYGPRQGPHGEAGVVAIFGRAMVAGRPTMIFGDGTSSHDSVHVADVVEALVACLDARTDGASVQCGTGRSTTIRELHELMATGRVDGHCCVDQGDHHRGGLLVSTRRQKRR